MDSGVEHEANSPMMIYAIRPENRDRVRAGIAEEMERLKGGFTERVATASVRFAARRIARAGRLAVRRLAAQAPRRTGLRRKIDAGIEAVPSTRRTPRCANI